ncbi:hypothetical protein J6590_043562 [Homalodisca vitripennis]|nr:hypothetical protein J6590_043562 [Homalodisca vitripennis]
MNPVHDPNNNNTLEKSYSLRPRTSARKEEPEAVNNEENWKPRNKARRKPKQKSVPLSKYRRKTANARERFRMREINQAFEALRRAIPHLNSSCENPNEKLTKISTLRLAMKYITALSNALQDTDFDSDGDSFLSEWTSTPPDHRESSTPSSVNEHSDIYDSFFSLSPSSESSPSTSSSFSLSALMTPPACEYINSDNHASLPTPTALQKHDPYTKKDERLFCSSGPAVDSRPLLTDPHSSTLEDDLSHHLLTSADLQNCSSSLLDELEGLPSPVVDLDDYLLT